MTTCPVCSGDLITANNGTVLYCPTCAAEGRSPLVEHAGASVPGPGAKAAVRGVQQAPCPFCGGMGREVSTADDFATASRRPEYYVACQSCGACGPPTRVKGASWIGWNVRKP